MKKGFTLIELLAVIVILAIIALIATPIILNIIGDAKEQSNKRSVELYAKSIENAVAQYQLNNKESISGTFTTSNDGKTLTKGQETLTIEYNGNVKCTTIKINEEKTVKLVGCSVNGGSNILYNYGPNGVSKIPTAVSFSSDSWETIAANVESGNLSKYKVGDTKEIALTGYTNREANSNGLYTVRIANTTTEECKNLASQSACGFVIEFVDIITTHNMNPSGEYKGTTYNWGWNKDGWPASDMYKFLNDTTDSNITSIYESLPEDLQKVIEPTQVVSSHGSYDSSNFTSTDKLYLLSTKEVWGKEGTLYVVRNDTAEEEIRQLDYYKNKGVTTSNYSGAIKNYNGTAYYWWLRSAASNAAASFYYLGTHGDWGIYYANYTNGVAPAFRIG